MRLPGTPILKDYVGDLVRSVYLGKEADETSSEPLAEWLQRGIWKIMKYIRWQTMN